MRHVRHVGPLVCSAAGRTLPASAAPLAAAPLGPPKDRCLCLEILPAQHFCIAAPVVVVALRLQLPLCWWLVVGNFGISVVALAPGRVIVLSVLVFSLFWFLLVCAHIAFPCSCYWYRCSRRCCHFAHVRFSTRLSVSSFVHVARSSVCSLRSFAHTLVCTIACLLVFLFHFIAWRSRCSRCYC